MSDTPLFMTCTRALCIALLLSAPAMLLADDLDDPMRPTSRQTEPEPEAQASPADPQPANPARFHPDFYHVTDIYLVGNIKRARINGTWYEPGDTLLNARILDVTPQAAVIQADDLYHILHLDRPRATFNLFEESQ